MGSGHVNAFSDICEIGEGGAVEIAKAAGIPVPESLLALGNDGCNVPPFKDSPEVWPEVRHFVTPSCASGRASMPSRSAWVTRCWPTSRRAALPPQP